MFDPLPGKHGIDKLRPIGAVQWLDEPEAPAAPAAVDYSQWIRLDTNNAVASYDSGSILGTVTSDTTGIEVQVTGTAATGTAWWVWNPVDAAGNSVLLTRFGLQVWCEWEGHTQPPDGSDIGLSFGFTQGTAAPSAFNTYGVYYDTASTGPKLLQYANTTFNTSGNSTADAAAKSVVTAQPAFWDNGATQQRFENRLGGSIVWLRAGTGGILYPDKIQLSSLNTVPLGSTASDIKIAMAVVEGAQAATFKAAIYYRVVPLHSASSP